VTKNAARRWRGSSRDRAASTTGRPVGARGGVLPAQHRHLMAEDQELDVLGSAVAGELGQHLQHLTQKQLYQRSAHGFGSLQAPATLISHRSARQPG
jgi:hypothetical protein